MPMHKYTKLFLSKPLSILCSLNKKLSQLISNPCKSDHTDWSTDYMPYETYCVIVTTRGIDQIQASLKNYSEFLYITDFVSVINFYVNNPRDHNHRPFGKQFTDQCSNTATCKLFFQFLEVHDDMCLNNSFHKQLLTRSFHVDSVCFRSSYALKISVQNS